jgi:hypothetical protein
MFSIETDSYVYVAQHQLRKFTKPANLTVNGSVRFADEKRKLFVIDDDGREHGMKIVRRVLKEPKQ